MLNKNKILPDNTRFYTITRRSDGRKAILHYGFIVNDSSSELGTKLDDQGNSTTSVQAPLGVSAYATGDGTNVRVTWQKSPDPTIEVYKIYRNGVLLGQRTEEAYLDLAVEADTAYSYQVVASDVYGNVSPPSEVASITVATYSPVTNVQATNGDQQVDFTWDAPVTQNTVSSYEILINGSVNNTISHPTLSGSATGLTNGFAYSASIRAVYSNGQKSDPSPLITVNPTVPAEEYFVVAPQNSDVVRVVDKDISQITNIDLPTSTNVANVESLEIDKNHKIIGTSTWDQRFVLTYDPVGQGLTAEFTDTTGFARASSCAFLPGTTQFIHGSAGNETRSGGIIEIWDWDDESLSGSYVGEGIGDSLFDNNGNAIEVMVTTGNGIIYALMPDDTNQWWLCRFTGGLIIEWRVNIGTNSDGYNSDRTRFGLACDATGRPIVSFGQTIKKFSTGGSEIWSISEDANVTNLDVEADGTFYIVMASTGEVKKYSAGSTLADPELQWNADIDTLSGDSSVPHCVAQSTAGYIYVGCDTGRVLRLDKTDGSVQAQGITSAGIIRAIATHPGRAGWL